MINKLLDNTLIIIFLTAIFLVLGIMQLKVALKHPEKIKSTSGDDNTIVLIATGVGCIIFSMELTLYHFFDFSIIKWLFAL